MNNVSEGSCVSRGGGGACSIDQKPPLIKKVYHKVNKYLFDYMIYHLGDIYSSTVTY